MKTLSVDESVPTEEMSRAIFAAHMKHWDLYDFGIWLFSKKTNAEFVGYCGLRNYRLSDADEIELYFGLRSRFFRLGFGTEMARAVTDIGFTELRLTSIIGFTAESNAGSRALMTKLGMSHDGIIEHAGLPHLMYRLRHF
jgi:RimJ/RimL family protein N-acetyltransferase